MKGKHGFSALEALVALGLSAIALAGLATTAGLAVRSLRTAHGFDVGLALATARLEALRAGPRADGEDVTVVDGTRFTRRWQATDGRGRPTSLAVEAGWDTHRLSLETECLP